MIVTHSPRKSITLYRQVVVMRSARYVPPIQACTPYHMQAIAALLNTGHREPHTPKEALLTTGKLMWYVAPMRPVKQMKTAAIRYPNHTQSHDCHHDRPPTIMEDDIIQVFYGTSTLSIADIQWSAYNIERICDPEANKIPSTPLSSLRFDCGTTSET